jgi:hypothetical protein
MSSSVNASLEPIPLPEALPGLPPGFAVAICSHGAELHRLQRPHGRYDASYATQSLVATASATPRITLRIGVRGAGLAEALWL